MQTISISSTEIQRMYKHLIKKKNYARFEYLKQKNNNKIKKKRNKI
jgi:outer membrane lipoprotein-sorting protein